jgi:glycosyltransferase involved in cell wall biosynthesis
MPLKVQPRAIRVCAGNHGRASQTPPSRPIRVLFIMDRLHETGGTLYYLHVLPRLDRARVTPLLCAFAPWHPIASRFQEVGIEPVFFGRKRWDPRCLTDVLRFVRRCKPDLLHSVGCTSFAFGRLGVHLARRPMILHFHSMLELPRFKALWNRRLMSSRWTAVAVSEAVRGWSIQEFGISPDRIAVLYNGHDIDRFGSATLDARARIRRELALADDTAVIGLVGRLNVAQKGQDVMIRAMRTLRGMRSDTVLLLVGDGPDRARCEALVRQLGLDDAVRFTGQRSDIPEVLAAVDVAVVPSVCDEGLPFVAIEASAAGRPVVAFDSGGLSEVVLHGRTGIVVPKGDIAGLAAAIAKLLDDSGLAKRLGEGGRRYASRFGLSEHVSELMDLYDAVLDEHHRSRGRSSAAGGRNGSEAAFP